MNDIERRNDERQAEFVQRNANCVYTDVMTLADVQRLGQAAMDDVLATMRSNAETAALYDTSKR